MNIKSIVAAVAVVACSQAAFAANGVTFASGSAPGTYGMTFGGDGDGIFTVTFSGTGITGVVFDGITLVNPFGFYTFDLGSNAGYTNYAGNTHSFTVSGTGAFTGQATWNDGATIPGGPVAAIPEPGTYAMFLAGLAAMGAVARRRRVK